MIRINLLSAREVQAEIGRRKDLAVAAVVLGATLALLLLVFLVQVFRSTALERELSGLRQEIAALEGQTKEVGSLQKRISELKEKVRVIEDLSRKKIGPVRVMESLSSAAPERLWVTEFKENSGNLALTGMAVDNQTVADFLKALSASSYFKDVELVETSQVQQEKVPLKKFSLRSRLLYQLPASDGESKGSADKTPSRSKRP